MALTKVSNSMLVQPVNRNLIINGAMQVAQRGTSATGVSNGYFTSDRWYLRRTATNVTFDSDVASGVLTCDNPSAATGFDLRHGIEWEDRFYGKTMTLTFTATTGSGTIHVDATVVDGTISTTTSQEFCYLTGTTTDISAYEGSGLVKNGNNYTVVFDVPSDADVSFTPDILRIAIGNTSAASQSITLANVKLEVGNTATPFDHRSYGEELALCQRYYQELSLDPRASASSGPGSSPSLSYALATPMRASPSADLVIGKNNGSSVNVYKPQKTSVGISTAQNGNINCSNCTFQLDAEL